MSVNNQIALLESFCVTVRTRLIRLWGRFEGRLTVAAPALRIAALPRSHISSMMTSEAVLISSRASSSAFLLHQQQHLLKDRHKVRRSRSLG